MDSKHSDQSSPTQGGQEPRERLIQKVVEMLLAADPDWVTERFSPSPSELAVLFEKAQLLANAAKQYFERPVFAYQLFKPNEPMLTARTIERRFEKAGWTGKGWGHVTLREKIETLLKFAAQETHRKSALRAGFITGGSQTLGSLQNVHNEIQSGVSSLFDKLQISSAVARPEVLKKAAVAAVEKLIDAQLRESHPDRQREDPGATLAIQNFMQFVCGHDNVADYCRSGPDKPIRAYELFLFASQHNHLPETFTASVGDWGQIISPVYRSSISILEAHEGLDAAIDDWINNTSPLRERIARSIQVGRGSNRAPVSESEPPSTSI